MDRGRTAPRVLLGGSGHIAGQRAGRRAAVPAAPGPEITTTLTRGLLTVAAGVLWVNIVPGAILRVVFESTAPVVGTCTTPTPIAAGSSLSTLVAEGTAGVHCFLAPGIFPYRVVIMMPDAEVALPGVVVVEE